MPIYINIYLDTYIHTYIYIYIYIHTQICTHTYITGGREPSDGLHQRHNGQLHNGRAHLHCHELSLRATLRRGCRAGLSACAPCYIASKTKRCCR